MQAVRLSLVARMVREVLGVAAGAFCADDGVADGFIR
jgi:hypothetical protein